MNAIARSSSACDHVAATLRLTTMKCAWLLVLGAAPISSARAVELSTSTPEFPEPVRQDLSFTLTVGEQVDIDNPYGSVYLRFGGYAHELGIHSTLQQPDGAAEIVFKPGSKGQLFLIEPRLPEGQLLASAQRLDIVVYVPKDHPVRVRTEAGDIESRGLKSDLDLRSSRGNIAARGTEGLLTLEAVEGNIEAALADDTPSGSHQQLTTRAGSILVGLSDRLDAVVIAATSAPFTTDFSLDITRHEGAEPNKTARATIGTPGRGKREATIRLDSRRGEIKLLRRTDYVEVRATDPNRSPNEEKKTQ